MVDASVTLAWLARGEHDRLALEVRDAILERGATVPILWRLEVANVLLAMRRRGRIGAEDVADAIASLSTLPIEPDRETWSRAWEGATVLASAHGLTVYDASYLELAHRRRLPLATFDRELRAAAAALDVALLC